MLRTLKLILMILLGFTLSGHAQTKRAMIICVGEQQDKDWADLNAEKDLQYVQKLLDFCRYADVTTISGCEATKQGMLDEFASLTSRYRKGDIIYIHFSGHGQRMTDINSDEIRIKKRIGMTRAGFPMMHT